MIFVYIFAPIVLLVFLFVVVVAMQPTDFRIARSATMAAPASTVFAQVNDLHHWDAWSPWAKLDPAMKQNYEGAPTGTGSSYTWIGNNKVGEGRMTITDSRPSEIITIRLEFKRPFMATNLAEFTFKPEDQKTVVTWSMSGKNGFMFKAFGLFMSMDKMLGGEFEKGLTSMKAIVEAAPR